MNKKDILELKRRFKKDECTFTRMCGCYVNAQKNVVLKLNETFLSLRDEEFFKYLEIARKALSGTVGNNLLELDFPLNGENIGDRQASMIGLKKSGLKDDALLDNFYKLIIDSYDYTGNFLILIFHDAYDVMTKTTDNSKLDESEEVYEYLLCAICPVSLAKPALGYLEDENRIGARIRDWIVGAPDLGFVFPAFTDRSTDINSVMYYTKDAKEPHPELMEKVLGCSSKQTAALQKEKFHSAICKAVGDDEERSDNLFMEIQESLSNMVNDHNAVNGNDAEPMILTNDNIQDVLTETGISEEIITKIKKSYAEEFGDATPAAEDLIDKKALAANEQKKKEERLEKKVRALEETLEKAEQNAVSDSEKESALESDNNSGYDVVLKVKPQKVAQIRSQMLDGKKCIIIPMDDNEQANVNGVKTLM